MKHRPKQKVVFYSEAFSVDAPKPQPGASSSTIPSTSARRSSVRRSPSSTPVSSAPARQITPFQSGGKRNTDLNDALIYMICKDNLPHSLVEKEGFSHFARVAVPLYKVPSRKTVRHFE
ncbi:hypothetical protein JTE90_024311 [Oedothorax gibbosus]|uniref:Uncharacterized protein n=1 Tax=Oedothorax gibbosus TaxID=931172 RepID=A0AAV6VZA6_9ARAC|nr:hypothetical protein JTE90_024311 [Oedothorax gibbosus]